MDSFDGFDDSVVGSPSFAGSRVGFQPGVGRTVAMWKVRTPSTNTLI